MFAFRVTWLCVLVATSNVLAVGWLSGDHEAPVDLKHLNRHLKGQVHDYTANHGQDARILSAALGQRRNLYVYVPPGYSADKRYPLVIWLHGLAQDETSFLSIVPTLDREIASGSLPKCVIVAPDGTYRGKASLKEPPPMYLNSPLGKFEDYIMYDVWNHATGKYSIHIEKQAHVLAGASMGAFGAFNLGIKYKNDFGVIAGVLPPLNLRYADRRGRTDSNYDPSTFAWLKEYRPDSTVARFGPLGMVAVKQRQLIAPVFGEGPDVIARVAAENPAEMLYSHDVKPGELEMFVGYGDRDEFNFDAQAESFAAIALGKGIKVHTVLVQGGKHDKETAALMIPNFVEWLRPKLKPYAPK